MLNTALVVALGGGLASQSVFYPDQIDVLRGADVTPQIELVLDTSGSMGDESWQYGVGYGCHPSTCSYYWSTRPPPTSANSGGYPYGVPTERDCVALDHLSRNDQVKAALTGCQSATDGILDKWDQRAIFAIRHFGDVGTALLEDFDPNFGNHAQLENAVLNLLDQGGTPLALGYVEAARHMNAFWNDSNTEQCRQNFIVLMTDGEGNVASPGNAPTMNWVSGLPSISISDTWSCFPSGCPGLTAPPFADAAAAYINDGVLGPGGMVIDALNNVTGNQQIKTYTIGFQAPFNGSQLLLAMANEGDGAYYNATDYQQLDQAFTDIITDIVGRANVTFSAGNVQNEGIFSGNYIYLSAFKPVEAGFWSGTIRKYCVLPANAADNTCFFRYAGGNPANGLENNPNPVDVWSGFNGLDAEQGGTGSRIWNDLFGVDDLNDPVPSNPLRRRRIYTWRDGQDGYVPVNDVYANDLSGLSMADTWTNNLCEHYALINHLHGYTHAVADCAAGNYAPQALARWPQGDTINGGTVLLKYSRTCENSGDRCYVATVANDGMLHFFNAVDGVETSAIIPSALWRPNRIANNVLADIENQPNLLQSRKYYFDGDLRIFHDDNGGDGSVPFAAGNGVIDPGEPAHLIAPLGRGGAAYISIPIPAGRGLALDGIPDSSVNPPRPLYPDHQTGFEFLEDAWAAPWIGRFRYQGQDRAVAVFSNGHRRQDDPPLAQIGAIQPGSGRAGDLDNDTSNPIRHQCAQAPANNWLGVNTNLCDPFGAIGVPESTCVASGTGICTPFPGPTMCCYDWPGWANIAPPPWDFSTTGGAGHSIIYGPISWQSGTSAQVGVAYRVGFDRLILQPGDYIAILDSRQNEAGRLTGAVDGFGNAVDLAVANGGVVYTPWVNDTSFYLQFRSNGVDDANAFMAPFRIAELQHVRRSFQPPAANVSYPTIYVVDANLWNGPNPDGSGGQGFAAIPTGAGHNRQADALLARITSNCTNQTGPNETCVDQSTNPNTTDLRYMVCGISSEISVYTEGDLLRSMYFMDRCGQIFKIDYNLRDPTNPWSARRLLTTNQTGPGGAPIVANSKDYRQGFAKVDIVLSSCNGRRSIGVYFGTGNMQRPAQFDNLTNASLAVFPNTERTYQVQPGLTTTVNVNANPGCSSYSSNCSGSTCNVCCDGICTNFSGCSNGVCTISGGGGPQFADVMGVVWDSPTLPQNASLADLVNVTSQLDIPVTAGTNGFFIELEQNEKMLRRPVVIDGIAYFKTYLPLEPATECLSARGEERFYAFDSCNARPVVDGSDFGQAVDSPDDRIVQTTAADIGGEILAVFPKAGDHILSTGDPGGGARELPKRPINRAVRMFMWRKFDL